MTTAASLALTLLAWVFSYCTGALFFSSTKKSVNLLDVPILAALGCLVLGAGWVFALAFDVSPEGVSFLIIAVGVFNAITKRRHLLRFNAPDIKLSEIPFVFLAFFCFGGLTLIASIRMGLGSEYSSVFFNMDSPLRLAHAHSILNSESYPPESIYVSGTYHAYHYGAPASVAALKFLTKLQMHKAMFWAFCPLMVAGIFAAIYKAVTTLVEDRMWRVGSLFLFAPFVMLWSGTFELIGDPGATLKTMTASLFDILVYNPATYGNGVWDASVLAGVFLLILSIQISSVEPIGRSAWQIFLLLILVVLNKMDMAVVVYVMLFLALWFKYPSYSITRKAALSLVAICLPLLLFSIFDYGGGKSEMKMAEVRTWIEVVEKLPLAEFWKQYYLADVFVVAAITAVLGTFWIFRDRNSAYRVTFGLMLSCAMFMTYVVPHIIHVPKTGGQFLLAIWIGAPFALVALIGVKRFPESMVFKLLTVPFLIFAAFVQLNKLHHGLIAITNPQLVEEYAEVEKLGEALSHIPVHFKEQIERDRAYIRYVKFYPDLNQAYLKQKGILSRAEWGRRHYERFGKKNKSRRIPEMNRSLVVTNDFNFVRFHDSQIALPAMLGHQTYGTHQRLFPGPDGYNVEASRRIQRQQSLLSVDSLIESGDQNSKILRVAYQLGWTHLILKKNWNREDSKTLAGRLPLQMIFENEKYAVYTF